MNFMHRDEEVNYFPSRFDPVRHAEKYPSHSSALLSGMREKTTIAKENNFKQPGERFRSWDSARQSRFITRVCDMLGDARLTKEIRRIWIGYWSQADASLGQAIAAKLQSMGCL
jgi:catalase